MQDGQVKVVDGHHLQEAVVDVLRSIFSVPRSGAARITLTIQGEIYGHFMVIALPHWPVLFSSREGRIFYDLLKVGRKRSAKLGFVGSPSTHNMQSAFL